MSAKKRVVQDKVIFYYDKDGDCRWKRVASNGRIVGASSEGFSSPVNCRTNFNRQLERDFNIEDKL